MRTPEEEGVDLVRADEMAVIASGSKSVPLLIFVAVIACYQLLWVQNDGAASSSPTRGNGRRHLATLVGGGEAYTEDDSLAADQGQAPFNPRSFAYVLIHYHKVR